MRRMELHKRSQWFQAGLIVVSLSACSGSDAPPPGNSDEPSPAPRAVEQVAYIKASNAGTGDQFGNGGVILGDAVTLSDDGSTLVVGASFETGGDAGINGNQDDNSVYAAGAVYVFTRDGDTWDQQAYLKASNPGQGDNFGFITALSADGDTLAVSANFEASAGTGVGANQNDDSILQAGAVYIFVRDDAGNWSQQAYLKASNTGELVKDEELWNDGDQFGFSVSLSHDGNTLAVGALAEDSAATGFNGDPSDNSAQSAGAVYLFTRNGETWTQEGYLKPTNTSAGDMFGYVVALNAAGDTLAASAFNEDGSPDGIDAEEGDDSVDTGAVYVFSRDGGAWSQTGYVKAENGERADSFGVSLAISNDGNTLAAGALDEDGMTTGVNQIPGDDQPTDTSAGAAYVFVRGDDGEWSQQAYIKPSNMGREDWFGVRLALSGDGNTLALSSQLEDSAAQGIDGLQGDDSADEAGAVYFFTRTDSNWSQRAYVKGSNTEAFDEFGSSIALNRDGSIMAVGALGEDSAATGLNGDQNDNSAREAGAVYLFSY